MMLRNLTDRYGLRGAWLILMGTVWCLIGVSWLLQPVPPHDLVLTDYLPANLNALLWGFTGVLAITQGLKGPEQNDTIGHVALYTMAILRVLANLLSALCYFVSVALNMVIPTIHIVGWEGGWFTALVWSVVSLALFLVAVWPNPIAVIPHPPAGASERE
jgi:hypothetical protein